MSCAGPLLQQVLVAAHGGALDVDRPLCLEVAVGVAIMSSLTAAWIAANIAEVSSCGGSPFAWLAILRNAKRAHLCTI